MCVCGGGGYGNVLHWGAPCVISQRVAGSGLYLVSGNDLVRELNGPPSKPIERSECASPSPTPAGLVWAYAAHEL